MKSSFAPRDALFLALLALIWGHSFLFIKTAVAAGVAPAWVVASRMLIGGALLSVMMLVLRSSIPRDRKTLSKLLLVGLMGSSVPWVAQAWAQHFLDSGLVAVLNACTPLLTLAMAVAAGQERLHGRRLVGIGIAIAGTVCVVGGELGAGRSFLALLIAVLATAGFAFAGVFTRAHISGRVPHLPAAALQLLFGALPLVPVAALLEGPPALDQAPNLVLGSLLALGVLGTGVAFLLYFTLIARVGATNTAMVTYLIPIVGLAAGAFYRGERFGSNVYLGAFGLLVGVWLAQRVPGAAPAPRAASSTHT